MLIVVSVMTVYNLYLYRKYFKLYRWWVGGLWVKHSDTDWSQCLWLIEPESGYVVDDTARAYHLTYRTVVRFENYTKEGYRL